MANPQKENGSTDIAHEIMEALMRIRIPGEARQIIDTVFRQTYGWHKKEDRIALSQFCGFTLMKKPTVIRAIKKAHAMNIIIIKKDNTNNSSYSINKDFSKWKPLSKKITLSKKIIGVIKKDNASLSLLSHTKQTTTKQTITKEIYAHPFEKFWKLYPKKKSKQVAIKAWAKLTHEEKEKVMLELPKHKNQPSWQDPKQFQYIPYPASWLNAKAFHDEVEQKAREQPPNKGKTAEDYDKEFLQLNQQQNG